MVGLKFSEIFYIEGCKNFVNLFTKNERQTPYLTMTEVESVLPSAFIRVHKSYIVNIEKIRHFDGAKITLNNDVTVPLGSAYKEKFLKRIEPIVLRSGR
jgi:DNA-binding LytR/AlgR family response regulator